MPGWIIQGVRGEGKSLCAVWMIKQYLARGCPVATNLDLWLESLVDRENSTPAYRLPDWPRYEDFVALPPAYDTKYKKEDRNGLLVLDELALWANTREWNAKGRDKLIKWLLLSRKLHWDLILLCQDAEMIDKQIQKTCCDYIVQSSRTDRTKIPYLGPLLETVGLSPRRKLSHVYNVYYGMTGKDVADDQWTFDGKDLYSAYDTNQIFTDGTELIGQSVLDMRSTFTYLPASYLTKWHYLRPYLEMVREIENLTFGGDLVALKPKNTKKDALYMKAGLLTVALAVFIGWRLLSGGFSMPDKTKAVSVVQSDLSAATGGVIPGPNQSVGLNPSQVFLDKLLTTYRPRLAAFITGKKKTGETVNTGLIEFYQGDGLVEQFTLDQLKSFGCAVAVKNYGIDVITSNGVYAVSAWPRPMGDAQKPIEAKSIKAVQTNTKPLTNSISPQNRQEENLDF